MAMAKYPVLASCFLSGQYYGPGDVVELGDSDAAAALVTRGTLGEPTRAARKGRPPSKRSAWTPSDDSDDTDE